MAKGQMRSTREKKKPKKDKVKPAAPAPKFGGAPMQPGSPAAGTKKW